MNMMWDVPYISEEARKIITGPRLPSNYDLFDAWEISKRSVNSTDMRYFGNMSTEQIPKFEHNRILQVITHDLEFSSKDLV
jgi:hypothetical protein